MGIVYSTIFPVFGLSFPIFSPAIERIPHRTLVIDRHTSFIEHGRVSGVYSMNCPSSGSNFATLQRFHSAIQSLSS